MPATDSPAATIAGAVRTLGIEAFLACGSPILDVRSPKEHRHGHIPGAIPLPLFTDEERAAVGTLYKQRGRDAAMLEGLRIVGPKLAGMVEAARAAAPDGRVRVHCWRGGERSASVAWLLAKAGFAEVSVLAGGYKAFRRHVQRSFDQPCPLHVLGGYTGTGKTEALGHLRALGAQTVDLEGLANHKGSAFGALGEAPQPSTEHFENLLWHALRQLDPQAPIWVEDESAMVGHCRIPDAFFAQMRRAPLHFAEMDRQERADRLVADYGRFAPEELAAAIRRIERRLGPQHCKAALEALAAGDLRTVALTALTYYDKAYGRGASLRDPATITRHPARSHDLMGLAARLIRHAHEPAR